METDANPCTHTVAYNSAHISSAVEKKAVLHPSECKNSVSYSESCRSSCVGILVPVAPQLTQNFSSVNIKTVSTGLHKENNINFVSESNAKQRDEPMGGEINFIQNLNEKENVCPTESKSIKCNDEDSESNESYDDFIDALSLKVKALLQDSDEEFEAEPFLFPVIGNKLSKEYVSHSEASKHSAIVHIQGEGIVSKVDSRPVALYHMKNIIGSDLMISHDSSQIFSQDRKKEEIEQLQLKSKECGLSERCDSHVSVINISQFSSSVNNVDEHLQDVLLCGQVKKSNIAKYSDKFSKMNKSENFSCNPALLYKAQNSELEQVANTLIKSEYMDFNVTDENLNLSNEITKKNCSLKHPFSDASSEISYSKCSLLLERDGCNYKRNNSPIVNVPSDSEAERSWAEIIVSAESAPCPFISCKPKYSLSKITQISDADFSLNSDANRIKLHSTECSTLSVKRNENNTQQILGERKCKLPNLSETKYVATLHDSGEISDFSEQPVFTSLSDFDANDRETPPLSASSVASSKRLEWDNGADVGYNIVKTTVNNHRDISKITRSEPEGVSLIAENANVSYNIACMPFRSNSINLTQNKPNENEQFGIANDLEVECCDLSEVNEVKNKSLYSLAERQAYDSVKTHISIKSVDDLHLPLKDLNESNISDGTSQLFKSSKTSNLDLDPVPESSLSISYKKVLNSSKENQLYESKQGFPVTNKLRNPVGKLNTINKCTTPDPEDSAHNYKELYQIDQNINKEETFHLVPRELFTVQDSYSVVTEDEIVNKQPPNNEKMTHQNSELAENKTEVDVHSDLDAKFVTEISELSRDNQDLLHSGPLFVLDKHTKNFFEENFSISKMVTNILHESSIADLTTNENLEVNPHIRWYPFVSGSDIQDIKDVSTQTAVSFIAEQAQETPACNAFYQESHNGIPERTSVPFNVTSDVFSLTEKFVSAEKSNTDKLGKTNKLSDHWSVLPKSFGNSSVAYPEMHSISNVEISKNNNTKSPFPISQVPSSEMQSVVSPCENDHLKVKTRNSLSETEVNSYSHECSKSNFDSVTLSCYSNRKMKTDALNSFNHGAASSELKISTSSILHNEEFNESVDWHAYESSKILSPELHHLHYNHLNTLGNAHLKLERREGVGQCRSIHASRSDEQNMNVSSSVSTSVECTVPKDTQYGKFSASAQHSSDLCERTKPLFDVEDKNSPISNQCVKRHAVQFLKNLNESVTGEDMNLQEALKKHPISVESGDALYTNQDLNACSGIVKSQYSSIFEHSKAFSENGRSDMHFNVTSSIQQSVALAESELKEFPEPDLETQSYAQSPVAKSLFDKTFENEIMLHEQKCKGISMTKDDARAKTNPNGDKVSSSFLVNSSLNNKIQDQDNSFQELSSVSRISSVKSTCQPVESKSSVQGNSYVSQNVLQTKQFSSRGCGTSDFMALYQKHLTGYQGNSSRSEDAFINKTEKIKFADKELQTMECYPCYQKVSNQANFPSSINKKTCVSAGCQVSEFDLQPPQKTTDSEIGSSHSFDMVKFKDFLNRTLAQRLLYGRQKSNKSGITFCLSSLCLCHNKKTLGEELFMNRPSFVTRSLMRQQEIKNRNKTLHTHSSSPVTLDIPFTVHGQHSKSEIKKTAKYLSDQKCFATKKCKVHIQKKYASPLEIFKQQQKALVKKNMLYKCNRMTAKLYSERLKEAALKGKLDHALNEQLLSP